MIPSRNQIFRPTTGRAYPKRVVQIAYTRDGAPRGVWTQRVGGWRSSPSGGYMKLAAFVAWCEKYGAGCTHPFSSAARVTRLSPAGESVQPAKDS